MFIRPNALSVDLICESPLMKPVLRSTRGSPATLLAMLLIYSRSRLALPLLRVPVYTLARRCIILLLVASPPPTGTVSARVATCQSEK